MSVQPHRPLPADACTLACRLRGLMVDAGLVAGAAVASLLVAGWLLEAVVWLSLMLALTWRPR